MVVALRVRVLDVEVVAARLDLAGRHLPGPLGLLPALARRPAPPVDAALQMLEADGPGHGIGLLALGHEMLVEPDIPGRLALLEEQQVGADGGVGPEDRVGQADDGVEVALLHQMFLEPGLYSLAEQRSVGQHHRGAPARLQQADDESEEQVRGLASAEMLREVRLDAVLLLAAEGRVGEHDVHPVLLLPADIGAGQGVVVADEARVLDAVQQHVGDAEHVRELFLLHRAERRLHGLLILGPLHVAPAHVAQRTGEEAAGAAGGVEQGLAKFRVDAVHHEGGDGARRVVLAGVARRLQIVEDLLVDVAEMLAFGQVVEIDLVDLVDHLAHQLAGLHVVMGVLEHAADDTAAVAGMSCHPEVLQGRKQVVVDEGEQFFAGDALRVRRPGAPLELLWNRRLVIALHHFQFPVLIVDDLEEEHPAQLADALGVAVHAGVLAHDVLDGFDEGADGHGLSGLSIEGGLKLVDGLDEVFQPAEGLDQLHRRAESGEGRNAQHVGVIQVEHAFVGVFGE